MSLPKIRLERCLDNGDGTFLPDGDQERHLRLVLRLGEGALVEGLSSGGERFLLQVERSDPHLLLRVLSSSSEMRDERRISLLVGLLKADQFDSVLRTASELGVERLLPVIASRSVPRIDSEDAPAKVRRWQRIADEATKVSGSLYPPVIEHPLPFSEVDWDSLCGERYAALIDEGALPIAELRPGSEVVLAVGPEGDWTPEESRTLIERGFTPIGLGTRVLRASTAVTVGVGWLRLIAG